MNFSRNQQLFAGAAVVVALGLAFFIFSRPKSKQASRSTDKALKDKDDTSKRSSKGTEAAAPVKKQPASSAAPAAAPAPAARAQAPAPAEPTSPESPDLKKAFDDANRMANKLYNAKEFARASEYFTECIKLCSEIPEYIGKLQTLYNNRSAMYEKMDELDKSMADIAVLLALNNEHDKGRVRKARILERKGLLREALVELCVVLLQRKREMLRGNEVGDSSAEAAKIEELVEKIVAEELPRAKEAARNNRGLPARYLLKQFFASFASYRRLPALSATADASELARRVNESEGDAQEHLRALLELVWFYTGGEAYETAFEGVRRAKAFVEGLSSQEKGSIDAVLLAQVLDLIATYYHLNNDLPTAEALYREALARVASVEPAQQQLQALVNLKLGGLLLDLGMNEQALEYYDRARDLDPENADVYVHRSQMWQVLKENDKARNDLETAVSKDPSLTSCYLRLAATYLATDPDQAERYLARAKEISPDDANVLSADIELAFFKGDIMNALETADRAAAIDPLNPLPLISKAMIYMQILTLYGGMMPNGQITPQDLLEICDKILEIDPHNETAYSQKAQMRLSLATSLPEMESALLIFDQAINNCRNTEDLEELVKYRAVARAQVEAARMTDGRGPI